MTLNKKKCVFRMNEIEFMGHLLLAKGIGPLLRVPSKSTPRSKGTNRQLRSEEFSGLGEFQRTIYQWPGNKSRAIKKTHTEEYTLCVGKGSKESL